MHPPPRQQSYQPPPPRQQSYQPPPQQQPFQPPQRYYHRTHRSKPSNFASCMLATFFLLLIAIIAIVLFFFLFKPQDPKIAVKSMKFPAFSLSNNTADFTFFQYAAVRNPNRYSFSHYDSSLQLYSYGNQVGFMFIPAGEIAPGRTQYMSARFDVKAIPVNQGPAMGGVAAVSGGGDAVGGGGGGSLELETRMKLVGKVKVLKVFAHHVESKSKCRVSIRVSDGAVLGYHC